MVDHLDVCSLEVLEGVGLCLGHAFALIALVDQGINASLDVVKGPDIRNLADADHVALFVQVVDVLQLEAACILSAKFCCSCFLVGDSLGFLESFFESVVFQDLQEAGIIDRPMRVGPVIQGVCVRAKFADQRVFLGNVVNTFADVSHGPRSSSLATAFKTLV